jgi:gliding motility-associated-like protein
VNDLPVVDAGGDQILCEPNGVTPSEVTLNGSGATSYTWDNGAVDGVPFTPPSGSTIFTVTGTDANGCQNTDWLEVVALTLPVANGSADGVYGNADYLVNFTNSSMYATNYTWDFGDNNTIQTTGLEGVSNTYLTPGIYDVLLTASNGICWDTWTIQIEVLPPMVVTPPNIFTPNGDGNNDVYYVNVEYGEDFEGVILNRWGNVITEVNGINASWDGNTDNGNPVAEGVYFVKYVATDFGGKIVEGHNFFHLER